MSAKPKYLPLGEVSHGTLKSEDIIPKLLEAADRVHMSKADRSRADLLREEFNSGQYDPDLMVEIMDLLTRYCPPYAYFGANEGDGSCFGCWVDDELINIGKLDGEIFVGDPVKNRHSKFVIPKGFKYRLTINDHGNMSLYSAKNGRVIWEIV